MAFDGPAAGIGGSLLSRLDLSESEPLKDCEREFQRCCTDAQFAAWARKWGAGAVVRLLAFDSIGEDAIPAEDHEALRDAKVEIEDAADDAVLEIRALLKDSKGPKTEAIGQIIDKLSEALEEHGEAVE